MGGEMRGGSDCGLVGTAREVELSRGKAGASRSQPSLAKGDARDFLELLATDRLAWALSALFSGVSLVVVVVGVVVPNRLDWWFQGSNSSPS